MLIGYARVSTEDQDSAAQVAALRTAGCERIWLRPKTGPNRESLNEGDGHRGSRRNQHRVTETHCP